MLHWILRGQVGSRGDFCEKLPDASPMPGRASPKRDVLLAKAGAIRNGDNTFMIRF